VNAVDLPATEALIAAVARASKALPITLTGGGDVFLASVDIRAFGSYAPAEKAAMIRAITRMTSVILSHSAPVVAAANGHALGGGFVLVLCDEVEANLMRRLAFTSAVIGAADLSAHDIADRLVAPSDLIGTARRAALETAAQPAFGVIKPRGRSGLIQRVKALARPGDDLLARFYET